MVSLLDDVQSKKPHFRFAFGVWSCSTYDHGGWTMGFGYTIQQAWADYKRWERQWAGEGLMP